MFEFSLGTMIPQGISKHCIAVCVSRRLAGYWEKFSISNHHASVDYQYGVPSERPLLLYDNATAQSWSLQQSVHIRFQTSWENLWCTPQDRFQYLNTNRLSVSSSLKTVLTRIISIVRVPSLWFHKDTHNSSDDEQSAPLLAWSLSGDPFFFRWGLSSWWSFHSKR